MQPELKEFLTVSQDVLADPELNAAAATDDRLEAIAKNIETLTATATLQIGAELAKARDIFRYRRDEGGFGGWVENRLHYRSRQTAYNLIHAYEQLGGQEVSKHLDTLGRSVLFLISAPSTPPEARDEIIERAKNGEKPTHAQAKQAIDIAKGRKPPAKNPPGRAALHAFMKLGPDVLARIEGTSLDNAREREALVRCNRGAPEGGLTEDVERLVAAAVRNAPVSAVALSRKLGPMPSLDVGRTSAGEIARLEARVEELQTERRRLEIENDGLRRRVAELEQKLHDGIPSTWKPVTTAAVAPGIPDFLDASARSSAAGAE
jgi:hypothetical protein